MRIAVSAKSGDVAVDATAVAEAVDRPLDDDREIAPRLQELVAATIQSLGDAPASAAAGDD